MKNINAKEFVSELMHALNGYSKDGSFDIKTDEMLTKDEVCQRLKVTRNTLTNWVKRGDFPEALSIGGQQRWPCSLINARIMEDNPKLHERNRLIAEARRITKSGVNV